MSPPPGVGELVTAFPAELPDWQLAPGSGRWRFL